MDDPGRLKDFFSNDNASSNDDGPRNANDRSSTYTVPGAYNTRWTDDYVESSSKFERSPSSYYGQRATNGNCKRWKEFEPSEKSNPDLGTYRSSVGARLRNTPVTEVLADTELPTICEKHLEEADELGIKTTCEEPPPDQCNTDKPSCYRDIHQYMHSYANDLSPRTVRFDLRWDILGFITEQLEGKPKLLRLLTLSGTMENAYAGTCEDYVRRFWPDFGVDLIEHLLEFAQRQGQDCTQTELTLDDHDSPRLEGEEGFEIKIPELDIKIHDTIPDSGVRSLMLKATASAKKLMKLAELLSWIAAVIRRPKVGTICYSVPTFTKLDDAHFEIGLMELQQVEKELCWASMFTDTVIAKGFPIPERNNEIGLEIAFDLMILLGRIWYPMEYMNGLVLKGYSTILVPSRITSESVQWHFISNRDPRERISMSSIKSSCGEVAEHIDISTLQTARTFVGWTEHARVHAAARSSGYSSIRESDAAFAPRRPRLARELTFGFGTSGLGFFGVQTSGKVVIAGGVYGPVKREHILLEDMLLNSRNNSSLLWDKGSMRGWIISELDLLLMTLHVWASRQTDSAALLDKIPFTEPSDDNGQASYQAIRAHRDLKLRSRSDGDGEDLMFLTQIENIFAILESRREEIITRNNMSRGFIYPPFLQGWELIDIAHSKPWFREKRVKIDKTCGTWLPLISKRPEVIVLFCHGIGDIIQPSFQHTLCPTWGSVPKHHSYLAATVASLMNLKIHCRAANKFGVCAFDGTNCPSRLQELDTKPPTRDIFVPCTGAVIVGKLHRSLYHICSPAFKQSECNPANMEHNPSLVCNTSYNHKSEGSDSPTTGLVSSPITPRSSHTGLLVNSERSNIISPKTEVDESEERRKTKECLSEPVGR